MRRGEIWWARLPKPTGSGPGYLRPVLIVQADEFTRSRLRTAIVAVITSNTRLAGMPGNLLLTRRASGLPKKSVVNVTQLVTIDKSLLSDRVRGLPSRVMARIDVGIRTVLSL